MLIECFPAALQNGVVKKIREFLASPFYLPLLVVLMVCANLFSLELPVFYCYFVLGGLCVLLGDDLRGVMPIILCCYMSISVENNPGMSVETSAFYKPAFMIQLVFLVASICVLLLGRLIVILMRGGRKKMPALTIGFAALGLSFILGGLFTKYYSFRTAFFGFVVGVSLCALYFFFYYGVDWKKTDQDWFAKIFFWIGLALIFEVAGMYVKSGMLFDPSIPRGKLITGWGMYNNVGCAMVMCLPAFHYLACVRKRGWIYTVLSILLLIAIAFTQSRSSVLFGAVLFAAGIAFVFVFGKEQRKQNALAIGCAAVLAAIALAILFSIPAFSEKIKALFASMFEQGISDNGRFEIYKEGLSHFASSPAFGVGFYQCTAPRWVEEIIKESAFLPPRYHDTFVQLLASGGIFATVCYLLHRLETVVLLFRRRSREKTFIALCVAGLLLTSLLDCHFFNLGPGLLYSVLLVCAEGYDETA